MNGGESRWNRRLVRMPLMAMAMLALLAGLCAGLQRIGWVLPASHPVQPMAHGPLMVSGFLGTLISLERAVALQRTWAYLAPLLAGTGGLLLVVSARAWLGPVLITTASGVLIVVFVVLLRQQDERFMWVMAAGAVAWLFGNLGWLFGAAVSEIVHFWLGFLVLTIAGERLELSRMLMHAPAVQHTFFTVAAAVAAGLLLGSLAPDAGTRLTGVALIALALWLARYDVVRHTIRTQGLTRYVAACLAAGYVWMLAGGVLMALYDTATAGPIYDAYLHAIFVGFVFSMIFGHAPIIFPSVLDVPTFYRPYFYAPLALLHASLLGRIIGDLGGGVGLRRWAAMGSAVAIVLFLVGVVYAVLTAHRSTSSAEPANAHRILRPR